MFGLLKKLFGGKPAETTQPEAAPYKVEAAPTPVADKAVEAVVKSVAKPAPKKAAKPAQKKPAVQKPAGAKKAPKKAKSTKA